MHEPCQRYACDSVLVMGRWLEKSTKTAWLQPKPATEPYSPIPMPR